MGAREDLVIRGEAVILLKAAIMRSVGNIKEGQDIGECFDTSPHWGEGV